MDSQIEVKRVSRDLYQRGTHRLLGNPFLGSFTSFLTLLFLLRIAANLYLAIDLSIKGSNIDAVQIASTHFVLLSAYAVWVGSLASLRVSFALPRLCFIRFAPHGRRFRSHFIQQIVFWRPMNIASLFLMLLTAFVFSMGNANWHAVAARGLVVLSFTSVGIVIVIAIASWSVSSWSDIQIIEMFYLLFLVALNPDIGSFDNSVSILFGGIYYSLSSLWEVGFTVGLIVAIALLILLLVRMLSAMSNLFRRQLSLGTMERWYWRIIRIRSWVLLYVIVAPVFISPFISSSTKRWVLVLSILFGVVSYLFFITQCENALHEKWRCSLFDKRNIRLVARSALTHILLVIIPVLAYIIC